MKHTELQHTTVTEPPSALNEEPSRTNANKLVGLQPGAASVGRRADQKQAPSDPPQQQDALRANHDVEIAHADTVTEPAVFEAHQEVDMSSNDEDVAKEEENPKVETRAFLSLFSRKIWIASIVLLVGIAAIGLVAGLTSNHSTPPSNDASVVEDAASMPPTEASTSMPTPLTELMALIKSQALRIPLLLNH